MVQDNNNHPLLLELLKHVGGPRLGKIVRAFEDAGDEGQATAISTSISQIFEQTVEGILREDTQN